MLNPWFNRRLTGIRAFVSPKFNVDNSTVVNAQVIASDNYPYYQWLSTADINNIAHFATYSTYEFSKGLFGGEAVPGITQSSDPTTGVNAYSLDISSVLGGWYVKIRNDYNGWVNATKTGGLRFLSMVNRWIDEDNTMNYTRGTFNGQTNGRFFAIGVKNTVGKEPFESNDIIPYNVYANGVSEYDTYSTMRYITVVMGDKDQVRGIANDKGFLVVVKDTNAYIADVNTEKEVNYAPVDTQIGRGCSDPNLIVQTPHGIVMPTTDGVWLLGSHGSKRILTSGNGKLNYYKYLYNSPNLTFKAGVFSNEYNELFLFFSIPHDDVMVALSYSFERDVWGYHYDFGTLIKPISVRVNWDKQICISNFDDIDNYNIVYFSEDSKEFIKPNGASIPIPITIGTHYLAYAGMINDFNLIALTTHIDAAVSGTVNLSVTTYSEQGTFNTTIPLSTADNQVVETPLGLGVTKQASIVLSASSLNLTKFSLNSFYLWITTQARKIQKKP